MSVHGSVRIGLLDVIQTTAEDVTSTVAFYRDVLGADVQESGEHWARLRLGGVDIGVHAAPAMYEGWMPAFRVADIEGVRAAVLAAGLECRDYHDIPGGVTLQFRDPSGHWLSAVQYGVSAQELTSRA